MSTQSRAVGGTEHNWCRAVVGGTGIAVLAIISSKNPDVSHLKNALHKLQISHPILRSRLHYSPTANSYSFVTSPSPFIQIKYFNHSTTCQILENNQNISPLHLILEHELNQNAWVSSSCTTKHDVFFASVYALPGATRWVLVLRLHAAACDRTTAVSLLRELLTLMAIEEEETGFQQGQKEITMNKGEISLAMEDILPKGIVKKTLWARGVDMLSYSVNSLRFTNLRFKDAKSPRSTQVVRLLINPDDTQKILTGCKARGIKLCGALGAAGLIAAHSSKSRSDHQKKKYGVVTLTDCRSILEPPLSNHHFGFYHSAILNTHAIKGGEKLWELAEKVYTVFTHYKSCNKHLSDMADLNFLMCRAMENPGLTPSASLRTCLISVFEDTVIDESSNQQNQVGVEDYMGCASAHGIAPSIAIFDTIRDGRLDCICVYPSPLHSREQMQELVDNMKCILVDAGKNVADETES
ncbi:hypothetical protein E1A91_D04G116100v1 [Gossypium mustelinum]|uniref:Condensation domain-containing protein n=4 Tax=Gossypium TaxID=3633 RepID=A0A5D2VCR4_GOSMU|nr:hypothetical protein ES319_D04G113400v1 [Gossypium barbadense]TYG73679.1 hypothetical protein ES288_D04G121200v1 [Gossypium darwinii]TYH76985.1 hypothetical protein ES332_D04G123100v1 [Gossypium tomentosum]TYI87143.1 hypothetical protein E1A91_D04G116100v1 [Gossypium mustelinum]TYI87144.1 hypothetical protein E1A91_D04G116100v1 [Gossypium mustelinum]